MGLNSLSEIYARRDVMSHQCDYSLLDILHLIGLILSFLDYNTPWFVPPQ